MKKIVWLLLTVIVVGVLSGCLGQKDDASSSSGDTIRWFVDSEWYSKQWDEKNVALDKLITEETGLRIEFISGNAEKLGAMIASKDIPDVVTVWNIAPQRKVLENSGLVAPLDELIKEHAPNFDVPQSVIDWYSNEDGHLYGLPNYFYAEEQLESTENLPTHTSIVARKDFMEQLGIEPEDFSTKAGTIAALKKVKDAKLKYNGFDVIPAYYDLTNIMQFFGAPLEDKEGNYQEKIRTPEALESLLFLNELYREGLLPQDSLTLTEQQKEEKVNAGSVFSFTNSLITYEGLAAQDPKALYVAVGPIKGDAGNKMYFDPSPISGWTLTMIGENSKKKAEIIKLLEFLSTEEMVLNAQFGAKGYAWEPDEDGRVVYKEDYQKELEKDPTQARMKSGADSLPWLINWIYVMRASPEPKTPYDIAIAEKDAYFEQFSFYSLAFEATNTQGGTEEGSIQTKIDDYRSQMTAKMVMAKSSDEVKSLYDEMLEQEDKLGYDKLYEYKNKAFKEAKEKLGLEFAWPGNQ
ncbi:hypothetical protein [Lederbergia graminis]|uniref:ABC transporter substrate-binding protein n=1 Tax=Lederbergia graminis TaxID=735518 RepID=A0ABW0LJ21_9BACI